MHFYHASEHATWNATWISKSQAILATGASKFQVSSCSYNLDCMHPGLVCIFYMFESVRVGLGQACGHKEFIVFVAVSIPLLS